MDKNYLKQLKNSSLFQTFTMDEISNIIDAYEHLFYIKHYATDEIIYLQNQSCKTLDLILKGEIIIKRIDLNGNVMVMDNFYAGDDFSGSLLFSTDGYYPMTIFSNTQTTILHLKKEFILQLCHDNKKFLKTFLESVATKNFKLTKRVTLLSLETLREKIIYYLQQRYLQNNKKTLPIITSKKEMASKLGVARTSLSRELNNLKKEGLIDYDNKTFYLKDSFPFEISF